jgi:DNA-binding transcriptional regulator YhcF (GntR family)
VKGRRVEPAYLRIAGMLRADIVGGRFAAGARLPSETQLMMRHEVSRSVAKWAIAVLKADGLVEGRQGSGVFVRAPKRASRHPYSFGSSWRADLQEVIKADRVIAARLVLMPGDSVIHTRSRSLPADGPIQIMEAWRPAGDRQGSTADRCRVVPGAARRWTPPHAPATGQRSRSTRRRPTRRSNSASAGCRKAPTCCCSNPPCTPSTSSSGSSARSARRSCRSSSPANTQLTRDGQLTPAEYGDVLTEQLNVVQRSGAAMIVTYAAKEAARMINNDVDRKAIPAQQPVGAGVARQPEFAQHQHPGEHG